ncbi:MAG TPA: protein-disulfide reductase DsbD [Rhodocyclaceae bacterium]|nr:protein-disulfide reductase DsbD [Rhodocyclaceae bacterium]HNC61891.1 protein-disulfide reductase DsbD [Rhodocyclaceae bacterium]HNH99700.1 protein-disulfide reductase DsbD [Rhodocyclaceae bacterium]
MRRFVFLLLALLPVLAIAAQEVLPPEKAFRFTTASPDGRTVEVRFDIEPGYYLYRERLRFETGDAALGAPALPTGKMKKDETFGNVEVYYDGVVARLPVDAAEGVKSLKLNVTSQGCADIGICFPPQTQAVEVALGSGGGSGSALPQIAAAGQSAAGASSRAEASAADGRSFDESGRIARLLKTGSWLAIIGAFFGFGVLLAFTPCTFPMIPIVSSIVLGRGQAISRARAAVLCSVYVLAMAFAYAAAGVAAGMSGTMLSAALQNAWVLGAFGALFVVLSLSMFGFYELQLPSALQSRLSDVSSHQQGGSVLGVATMGMLSALIVGPCVAAPLAGALLYIAQTGDARLGGLALFAMGVGTGAPLMVFALSAHHVLPKSGAWMESVKKFFGVLMLGMAIWIVSPVVPPVASMLAWAALLIFSAMYLHALDPLPAHAHGWQRFWKGVGVVSLLTGAALLVGALAGSRDPLQPLAVLRSAAAPAADHVRFERVATVAELEQRIASAKQPVMLDFYADWCVSCKEMERFTFNEAQVKSRLRNMLLLQADVTANSDHDKALLAKFNLFGPPGIVFFDKSGREIDGLRVVGFQNAGEFLPVLDRALGG